MTLNFIFLLPTGNAQFNQFEVSYTEATGVPIPIIGDVVGQAGGGTGYPVTARTFSYAGAESLTIYFACGD
jgi:hypothetical protein